MIRHSYETKKCLLRSLIFRLFTHEPNLIDLSQIALFYILVGAAFFGLTLKPSFSHRFFYNIPAFYLCVGAVSVGIGLPYINPLRSSVDLKIIEHASELIVLISLAGAGLAIDTKAGWRRWQATWRLLGLTMPLTIIGIAGLAMWFGGLGLAGAALLGATLAPTDPVLARSVQVGPPGTGDAPDDTHGVRGSLTAEAGLNDALAFPFVWLAIVILAGMDSAAFIKWFSLDFLYRTGAGLIVGLAAGHLLSRMIYSEIGDGGTTRSNSALVLLATVCLSYGFAELIGGYGFLSVFVAARAARIETEDSEAKPYERAAHRSADQLESILLALLLLWFGSFIAHSLWSAWTWTDLLIATIIVFLVRPIAAYLGFLGMNCARDERAKMAFFGIRGMGTIFYISFAQSHGDFNDIEAVWRIAGLTILLSIVVHGSLAQVLMRQDDDDGEKVETTIS